MRTIHPVGRRKATIGWTAVAVVVLASAGCGGGMLRGGVVDAQTAQPIAGATVYADWSAPCSESWRCSSYRANVWYGSIISSVGEDGEAETDTQGEFLLKRPSFFDKGTEIIAVHKCGYSLGEKRTNHARGNHEDPATPVEMRITTAPAGASGSVASGLPFPKLRAAVAACAGGRPAPGAPSGEPVQQRPSAGPERRHDP